MTADDTLDSGTVPEAIAAIGLATDLALPESPLDSRSWPVLLRDAQRHRLLGHAVHAVAAGALAVTDEQRAELATMDISWQHHALAMEWLLLRVVEHLDALGVATRVLKGTALAHTVYDDPAHRVFGDIDVLVAGADLATARTALVDALGGDDVLPELRPGFDAEFAKDVMVRVGGYEIDLHRTLASGPFGLRIPVDELFENAVPFVVGGRTLHTLPPVPTFLQVCYNAALGDIPPRLSSLRDVAQVHHALAPDTEAVLETTRRWGGQAVTARAVRLAWERLALEPCDLSRWAGGFEPGPLDRKLLAASTSESRSYTRAVAALAAIRGPAAKTRYLRGVLSPSPEYLAARGWTRRSHVSRALRRLRHHRH